MRNLLYVIGKRKACQDADSADLAEHEQALVEFFRVLRMPQEVVDSIVEQLRSFWTFVHSILIGGGCISALAGSDGGSFNRDPTGSAGGRAPRWVAVKRAVAYTRMHPSTDPRIRGHLIDTPR
jgi:hypothetical protein